MLQTYIVNILSISIRMYVSKYFMSQVFHERVRQGGAGEGGPLGHSGPRVRGSRRGAQSCILGRGSKAEHEVASIDG
jgi:hypothetical protein